MTLEQAKTILLMYRGPADAEDADIAAALEMVQADPGLRHWFEEMRGRQASLREQFRQIPVPAGLKQRILAEWIDAAPPKASWMNADWTIIFRPRVLGVLGAAVAVILLVLGPIWYLQHRPPPPLTLYQEQMIGVALRGYAMDLATNNPEAIRTFLSRQGAPADYALPPGVTRLQTTGCAVETWNKAKVSMICFRTGRPLPNGQQNDLWLFVVDRSAVKNSPASKTPVFSSLNQLVIATWAEGDKFYLLGTAADEATVRGWL
ncbi:MAG TPA: anti-sigma factor [Verrucomicrobiae bacterium]|nr:anti-sigma factor [Verrucomicrobiae bacterium]